MHVRRATLRAANSISRDTESLERESLNVHKVFAETVKRLVPLKAEHDRLTRTLSSAELNSVAFAQEVPSSITSSQASIDEMKDRHEALEKQAQASEVDIAALKSRIDAVDEELAKLQAEGARKAKEMQRILDAYELRLGLRLSKVAEGFQLTYTDIGKSIILVRDDETGHLYLKGLREPVKIDPGDGLAISRALYLAREELNGSL